MDPFYIYNPINDPTTIVSAVIAELSENPELLQSLQSITGFIGVTGPTGNSGSGGGSILPSISQNVYVSQQGSDISGNGTIGSPFGSISHALSTITDASNTKYYTINVSNGTYNEGNIVMIPYVWLKGQEASNTIIQSTNINISSDFSSGNTQIVSIDNITINGFGVGLFMSNMINTTVYLSNIISPSMDILIIGGNNVNVNIDNIKIYNYSGIGHIFYDCNGNVYNSYIYLLEIGATVIDTNINLYNTFSYISRFSDGGSFNTNIDMYGCQIASQLSLQNNGFLTFSCDSDCILTNNIIYNAGTISGVINNLSNSQFLNYNPSGSSNWPITQTPTVVSTALDLLSSKQFAFTQMNTTGTTNSNTYVAMVPDVSISITPKFSGNIFLNGIFGGLSGNILDTPISCRIYNMTTNEEICKQLYTVTSNSFNSIGSTNLIGYQTGLTIGNTYVYQLQLLSTNSSDINYASYNSCCNLVAYEI